MRVLGLVLLGWAGGITCALALVRGAREVPRRPPAPPTISHVRLAPRAYDWERSEGNIVS